MPDSSSQAASTCPEHVLAQLKRIHAPIVVGAPPVNAFRDLVQLPDGEVRHYGMRRMGDDVQCIYISSRDCGLSWQEHPARENCPGACVQSPWSGDWLTVTSVHRGHKEDWRTVSRQCPANGTYVHRSSDGIDGPFVSQQISDVVHGMPRQPLALRHRQRWVVATAASHGPDGMKHPVVFYSDDDGHTWQRTMLETVGPHRVEWPHAGVRWQNCACEPSVVELDDGRLWMLMRTSQDNHHEAFSKDGGVTWTTPQPSRFYGTLTMPTLFRLNDGRLIVFWCNTTPLPELDHATQPELNDGERQGKSEDVFTNRDAFHAAISGDDGETWIGFREVLLSERRNDSDFRSSGGNAETLDKSVHQSQAVELPSGKVLVSVGQHPLCRKLVIFDPAWLYETERCGDFALGLGAWSVHQYVKSLSGNFRGITGHCAYNRRPGPQLIPDPTGEPREVLKIARHPDPRLLHERQGTTWNFPAGKAGQLRLRVRLPQGSQGTRICLVDRWFNPVDPVVHHFAQYVLEIDAVGRINGTPALDHDTWQNVEIRWNDTEGERAEFRVGQTDAWAPVELTQPSVNGLSYVHIQSMAHGADPLGLLVSEVAAVVNADGKTG